VHVTGVLFLHRIIDNKFTQTADRVSNMLKNICGDDAMKHLMLCTTMWDRVPEDEGSRRFDELRETGAWQEMILGGASVAKISNASSNARANAERIVTRLIKNAQPVELVIQDEMGNRNLKVVQTGAGQILNEHLQAVQAEARRDLEEVQMKLREERNAYLAKKQEAIRAKALEVERVKAQAEELKREQEKAKRHIKQLREQTNKGSETNVVNEQLLARETELELMKRQAEVLNEKSKQLKQGKKEAQKKAKKAVAAQAARAKEEESAQRREIDDARRHLDALAGKSQRGGLLKLLGFS